MVNAVLVASATATTGAATVHALSNLSIPVRAMVRKADDPRAVELAKLPGVSLVEGDFDDHESIRKVLQGSKRALLVSGAFSHDQFERETFFVEEAAKLDYEAIVRVSTASGLIKPGTKGAYGRAHHGIQSFCEVGKYKVIHLNPNWFLTNFLGFAETAKNGGVIALPVSGTGARSRMIDPRDIGSAAAMILTLPTKDLGPFLAKKYIEVHGPGPVNFAEKVAAISSAVGYDIKIQQIPREAFSQALQSMGIPRVFAESYLETIEQIDGVVPPGYECYPAPNYENVESSTELLNIGWKPAHTVESWAKSDLVMRAFAK